MRSLRWLLIATLITFTAASAQECKVPVIAPSNENILTPVQAVQFGNIIAEQIGPDLEIVNNASLTAELQRIGDRLTRQLSPDVPVHFVLSDLPEANAFTFPGGHVYVTRKLIALTHSEDELAAVIAHELGHVLSHDPEITLSRELQKTLGITRLAPDADLLHIYNQLINNFARNPSETSREHEQRKQVSADRVGVFALASAGYDPGAFAQFWDRMTENKSAKGNWFSNLFGTTAPDSQRFREALKNSTAIPAACIHKEPLNTEKYKAWRAAVIEGESTVASEKVGHVVRKVKLEPPLRPDLSHIQFSPDGKWVLAQDETSIYVISREPLAFKFRIDAPEAEEAQFTPDSRSIVFDNDDLRVQQWDIAEQKRVSVHELSVPDGCFESQLAPDGKTVACVDLDAGLRLIDVATGEAVFQKKHFYTFDWDDVWVLRLAAELQRLGYDEPTPRLFQMEFTPDGHYFVVARGGTHMAVDVVQRAPLTLGSGVGRVLAGGFTFYGTQRLLGINVNDPRKSAMVNFPSGETLANYAISPRDLQAPAHGDQYAVVRPAGQYAAGLLELSKQQVVLGNKTRALDIYDDIFAAERKGGELEFYRMPSREVVGRVNLPEAPLGHLRAASVSLDFNSVAISEASRGGVWDLSDGKRAQLLTGFRGAYLSPDGGLYAIFPKQQRNPAALVRLGLRQAGVTVMFEQETTKVNPSKRDPGEDEEDAPPRSLPPALVQLKASNMRQFGAFVLAGNAAKDDDPSRNIDLTIYDTTSGKQLWSRHFSNESPTYIVTNNDQTLVLRWAASDKTSQFEINADPALRAELTSMHEKKGVALLEIVALADGKILGKLLVNTGRDSFTLEDVQAAGDYVVIDDEHNRTLVYRLSTGVQLGSVFGSRNALSAPSNLLLVENNAGEATLYSLPSMSKIEGFQFGSRLHFVRFSPDGKRLLVLTEKQDAYLLDVSDEKPIP